MATFQTQSTNGIPITVVYPAEKLPGNGSVLQFRIAKKTIQPAYDRALLPHLVQFDIGQRTIMLMLSDILQPSYWQRIRNVHGLLGNLEVADDIKIKVGASSQLARWLRIQTSGSQR
jgi:hypothetical protein